MLNVDLDIVLSLYLIDFILKLCRVLSDTKKNSKIKTAFKLPKLNWHLINLNIASIINF